MMAFFGVLVLSFLRKIGNKQLKTAVRGPKPLKFSSFFDIFRKKETNFLG